MNEDLCSDQLFFLSVFYEADAFLKVTRHERFRFILEAFLCSQKWDSAKEKKDTKSPQI